MSKKIIEENGTITILFFNYTKKYALWSEFRTRVLP